MKLTDFLQKPSNQEGHRGRYFKHLKKHYFNLRIPYPAKLSFEIERRIKPSMINRNLNNI
jgi:hypothetical protein